jgi:hypothetical protein
VRIIPGVKKVEFDLNVMVVEFDEEIVSKETIITKAAQGSSRAPEEI